MKFAVFSGRNFKEIAREPMSLIMSILFPAVLLVVLSLLNQSIEGMAEIFEISNFTPSMVIMGLSFLGMFVGTLMAQDRHNAFLERLFSSPMKSLDYILGYSLPIIPLAILQAICCFAIAVIFGLDISINLLFSLLFLIPVSLLFIGFGLLMGTLFGSINAVNAFGTILVNATVFLSGAVFPITAIGGTFQKVCNALPFIHAVGVVQKSMSGNYSEILENLIWVLSYSVILIVPSMILFKRRMTK